MYNILRVVFSVRKLVQQHHKRKSFQRGKSRLEYFGSGTELEKMASLHGGLGSPKNPSSLEKPYEVITSKASNYFFF